MREVIGLLAVEHDGREVLGERQRVRDAVRERVEVVVSVVIFGVISVGGGSRDGGWRGGVMRFRSPFVGEKDTPTNHCRRAVKVVVVR